MENLYNELEELMNEKHNFNPHYSQICNFEKLVKNFDCKFFTISFSHPSHSKEIELDNTGDFLNFVVDSYIKKLQKRANILEFEIKEKIQEIAAIQKIT